jgi:signal peptidase II
MWVFGGVAAATIAIDAGSKALVVAGLRPSEPVRLLGGVIYLTLIRNSGAAFSMASRFTLGLSVLAVAVVCAIAWFAWRRLGSAWWAVSLGLIAGGALGNLVDRAFRPPGFMRGHVVDFISLFNPYGEGWAIFNLADSSLVIGVCIVVFLELTGRRIDGTRVTKDQAVGE